MRLTKRLLEAMSAAVTAMAAGMQGEGDWPEDVAERDLDDAGDWIAEQLGRRERAKAERKEAQQAADEEATYRLWNKEP